MLSRATLASSRRRDALCWIHAERLVHKCSPSDTQRNAVEIAKDDWWFYRPEAIRLLPCEQAQVLVRSFDRIFNAPRRDTPSSIGCSGGCFRTRRGSCAFSTPRNSAQHQRIRKRHPRLVTKRKISGDRRDMWSRRARHYAL